MRIGLMMKLESNDDYHEDGCWRARIFLHIFLKAAFITKISCVKIPKDHLFSLEFGELKAAA